MDEIYSLTVEYVGQAGEDLLLLPSLYADKYWFRDADKVKIVEPDGQVVEMSAEFSIPLGTPSYIYLLLIHNTQKDEIPIGSQIWIKSL